MVGQTAAIAAQPSAAHAPAFHNSGERLHSSSTNFDEPEASQESGDASASSFRVLGIALIVEQLGKGARMVLRYPTSPTTTTSSSRAQRQWESQNPEFTTSAATSNNNDANLRPSGTTGSNNNTKGNRSTDNLFFGLPPRQMAKLFRPKTALCGQPITLSVGGTIFCCCALEMESNHHDDNMKAASASGAIKDGFRNVKEDNTNSSTRISGRNDNNTGTSTSSIISTSSSNSSLVGAAASAGLHSEVKVGNPAENEAFADPSSSSAASSKNCNNGISDNSATGFGSDKLVLFSVVVALAPQVPSSSIPISGWLDEEAGSGGGDTQQQSFYRRLQETLSLDSAGTYPTWKDKASASFLCVRRVHVSLARLARVLEREEHRCRYVSLQSNWFEQIHTDLNMKWQEERQQATSAKASSGDGGGCSTDDNNPGTNSSSGSGNIASKPQTSSVSSSIATGRPSAIGMASGGGDASSSSDHRGSRHGRRGGSFSSGNLGDLSRNENGVGGGGDDEGSEKALFDGSISMHEQQQVALETYMASQPPPTDCFNGIEHHGNLAYELVQVYHALARNDHDLLQSPASLLSGGGGVVHVNRHIAVAIEAVTAPKHRNKTAASPTSWTCDVVNIRPYHTLLFPDASPSQLIDSMTSSALGGSVAPRRLEQLLRMVNPQKSLTEIAVDANLPLQTTIDLAVYLVRQGACVSSPAISRNTRLACHGMDRIRDVSLSFSQTFSTTINLFVLVSFLTNSSSTLGEALVAITTASDPKAMWLREQLRMCLPLRPQGLSSSFVSVEHHHHGNSSKASATFLLPDNAHSDKRNVLPGVGASQDTDLQHHHRIEDMEELLYQMAVWLCSHEVLVHMQEYLIVTAVHDDSKRRIDEDEPMGCSLDDSNAERKYESNVRLDQPTNHQSVDDVMLRELSNAGCLRGKSSLQSCSWKTGFDVPKLRSFALRHEAIRVVARIPTGGDD